MREFFPPGAAVNPGEGFYTIRPEDVGRTVIPMDIGPLNIRGIMGYVLRRDVGKRLYRKIDGTGYAYWQVESDRQFRERTEAKRERGIQA